MHRISIRTDDWPERERVAMFHEVHGRDRIRVEPARDQPLRIRATILRLPDLALLSGWRSPLRSEFFDGNDRLVFNLGGPAVATQFGGRCHSSRATRSRSAAPIAAR